MTIVYLYLIIISLIFIKITDAGKYERRLLHKLFKEQGYNPLERPVENENESLEVVVGMAVQQIVDLDEKMQVLKCSGWMDYGWKDYNLKWDPLDYGNITFIRVPATNIWTPDVLLYNTADDSFDTSHKVNAVIEYTGQVKYLPPVVLKSTCSIAIADFPFDEQECSLKFGVWTHDESKINLTALSETAQLDSFSPNGEWDLRSVKSYRESLKYDCCVEKYPFVLFTFHIRRRTLYFIFNLIFPCILISFMTVLGFALPPDSGEKVALEITTLLSIIMFLQLITGIIPEDSQAVPKIGIYFASVMLICATSVIANVIILIFHHRNVKIHKMPPWIKKWICGYLASFLRMKHPNQPNPKFNPIKRKSKQYDFINEYKETSSKSLLANIIDDKTHEFILNDDFGIIKSSVFKIDENDRRLRSSSLNISAHNNELYTLKKDVNKILIKLLSISKKLEDNEEEGDRSLDWKFAAMVLDKLCLYVFGILTIVSTCGILMSSPNFFKYKRLTTSYRMI